MKISLNISMSPPAPTPKEYCAPDLLEKVMSYIELINSTHEESEREWKYLKALYSKLCNKKKLSQPEKEILFVLEPEILKHSAVDSGDDQVMLDAATYGRVKESDL